MVSFTISVTTTGLSASLYRKSPTPSLCSIHSYCSSPSPPPYQTQSQHTHYNSSSSNNYNGSLDTLLPPIRSNTFNPRRKRRSTKMVSLRHGNTESSGEMGSSSIPIERRKSFGRGGAGNIRKPSVVPYAARTNEDGTPRRSSVWSISPGSSPEGKRATIMSWFGRKDSVDEGENHDEVKFKEVDLSGK